MTTSFHEAHIDLTPTYRRRPRRGVVPIDITAFHHAVDAAMEAFQADVSYAVQMARAAVTITRKREVWQARRDARAEQG